MRFYLIYVPNGDTTKWEAMSEISVPDTGAFPAHWYREYKVPKEKNEEVFKKLIDIKEDMNKQGIVPTKERNIFPELEDTLKST